jgi:hypothetical protein
MTSQSVAWVLAAMLAASPVAWAAAEPGKTAAPAKAPKAPTVAEEPAEKPISIVDENGWWLGGGHFRLPLDVKAAGYDRFDRPVEVDLDFTEVLTGLRREAALNDASLRLVELNETGGIVDRRVPFQFDRADDYNDSARARGTLVFLMRGRTAADGVRRFQVYFDLGGTSPLPAPMAPLILRHESVQCEGQPSFKIVSPTATYFYQQRGAALASLLDLDDCEWIGYHAGGGSAGDYRGLPNLVEPEGFFSAGGTRGESTIWRRGAVKLTLDSQTSDRRWACRWEIFPGFARVSVLKAARPYWFLYAGTPGGKLDAAKDFVLRSSGEKLPLAKDWTSTTRGPEWVLFGSARTPRGLFIVRHEAEALSDSCETLERNMVIFGFGRKGPAEPAIEFAPRHFTIGFVENTADPAVGKTIDSAWRPLTVTVGKAEAKRAAKTKG